MAWQPKWHDNQAYKLLLKTAHNEFIDFNTKYKNEINELDNPLKLAYGFFCTLFSF